MSFYRNILADIFYEWASQTAAARFNWELRPIDLVLGADRKLFQGIWRSELRRLGAKRRRITGLENPWDTELPEKYWIAGHKSFVDFVSVPNGYNMVVDVPDDLALKILALGCIPLPEERVR